MYSLWPTRIKVKFVAFYDLYTASGSAALSVGLNTGNWLFPSTHIELFSESLLKIVISISGYYTDIVYIIR